MLSDVNPKRRWRLAIVAIVAVAVAGFVIFRKDPKDVPRLVVLGQKQVNGQKVVVFRFDAPKRTTAVLTTMWTMNPSTGKHRHAVSESQAPQATTVVSRRASVVAAAGQSTLFHVLTPPDDVWRLLCEVMVEEKGISTVLVRVKGCWQLKSLAPLGEKNVDFWSAGSFIGSELITNAIPATTETPTK